MSSSSNASVASALRGDGIQPQRVCEASARAQVHKNLGDHRAALACYDAALRLAPGAWAARAVCALRGLATVDRAAAAAAAAAAAEGACAAAAAGMRAAHFNKARSLQSLSDELLGAYAPARGALVFCEFRQLFVVLFHSTRHSMAILLC